MRAQGITVAVAAPQPCGAACYVQEVVDQGTELEASPRFSRQSTKRHVHAAVRFSIRTILLYIFSIGAHDGKPVLLRNNTVLAKLVYHVLVGEQVGKEGLRCARKHDSEHGGLKV